MVRVFNDFKNETISFNQFLNRLGTVSFATAIVLLLSSRRLQSDETLLMIPSDL